jgi:hypothetical protein
MITLICISGRIDAQVKPPDVDIVGVGLSALMYVFVISLFSEFMLNDVSFLIRIGYTTLPMFWQPLMLKGKIESSALQRARKLLLPLLPSAMFVVVPPGDESKPVTCPVCHEQLKSEFLEDDEEWVWKNAISMRGKVRAASLEYWFVIVR